MRLWEDVISSVKAQAAQKSASDLEETSMLGQCLCMCTFGRWKYYQW